MSGCVPTFVEHFHGFATTGTSSVVTPTRQVLGNENELAHTTFFKGAGPQ